MIRSLLIAGVIGLVSVPASAQIGGPNKDSFLLTDKEAIGVMPPEVAVAGGVDMAMWSSDGKYVLARRTGIKMTQEVIKGLLARTLQRPPGEVAITVWDAKTHESKDVWKAAMGAGSIERVNWLPQSSTALAIISVTMPQKTPQEPIQRRRGILRINAETGTSKIVLDQPEDYNWDLNISPIRPVAILKYSKPEMVPTKTADGKEGMRVSVWNQSVSIVREGGTISQPIPLPENVVVQNVAWTATGDPILEGIDWPRPPGTKPTVKYLSLDVRTGTIKPTQTPPSALVFKPQGMDGPLHLKRGTTVVKEADSSRTLSTLWLETLTESTQPRALVALDATAGVISPAGDAVLYQSSGTAYVAPLIRMSKQDYAQLVDAAQRTVVLSNAKQLGLAALMYAQDYDENLPGAGGDLNGKLTPYLQNSSLFDGFVYTFGGGPLKDIAEPANTELGYVNGPGGKAVIFADGHVKWRGDK